QTAANNYFNSVFNGQGVQSPSISLTFSTTNGTQVTATGSGTVPTLFLGLVGVNNIPITANSTVAWGMSRLRVALALDNTGSMADNGKMTALKTAAHNLLTMFKNAAKNPGDIYVSIIPFATDVNIGTGYVNA